MENNNTTLTAAEAWRAAFSLTYANVRKFLNDALFWAKVFLAFCYIVATFLLLFNESETLIPNGIGLAMFGFAIYYFNKKKIV